MGRINDIINQIKKRRVLAIDPASHSYAFAVIDRDKDVKLITCGKVSYKDTTMNEKLKIISATLPSLIERYNPTHIVVEETIYIQNPQTSRILAYIVGHLLGKALESEIEALDVKPMVWKAHVGYKKVSAQEKKVWEKEMGPKEAKKKAAFERKDRTKQILQKRFPGLELDDYDIWDAIGIGIWAVENDK